MRVVIDTNVLVSACLGDGAPAGVVRACLRGSVEPVVGSALFSEYEEVLGREALFRRSRLDLGERQELLDIFLSRCTWVRVYFGWRPNLVDEADNHLVELAVAAQAGAIVTGNTRHLRAGELQFPGIKILDPATFMSELNR
ncbi:MAG: putative toxin-antitoxin system toxin component, PIN family [Rubrivivax sp.]